VERTNTEINVDLFYNANDYRIKKQVGKISNDRQTKKINSDTWYLKKMCKLFGGPD